MFKYAAVNTITKSKICNQRGLFSNLMLGGKKLVTNIHTPKRISDQPVAMPKLGPCVKNRETVAKIRPEQIIKAAAWKTFRRLSPASEAIVPQKNGDIKVRVLR